MDMSSSNFDDWHFDSFLQNKTFHHNVMDMSSSHLVFLQYEHDDIPLGKTFFKKSNFGFSIHYFDEVYTLFMISSQILNDFQFDFHYSI